MTPGRPLFKTSAPCMHAGESPKRLRTRGLDSDPARSGPAGENPAPIPAGSVLPRFPPARAAAATVGRPPGARASAASAASMRCCTAAAAAPRSVGSVACAGRAASQMRSL